MPSVTKSHTPSKATQGGAAPRISSKLRTAIERMYQYGMTQRAAAAAAGISEGYLSKQLKRPHIQEYAEQRKIASVEAAKNLDGVRRARALERAVELMEGAKSEAVQARMVEFLASETRHGTPHVQITQHIGHPAYDYSGALGRAGPGKRGPKAPLVDITPPPDQPEVGETPGFDPTSGHHAQPQGAPSGLDRDGWTDHASDGEDWQDVENEG